MGFFAGGSSAVAFDEELGCQHLRWARVVFAFHIVIIVFDSVMKGFWV